MTTNSKLPARRGNPVQWWDSERKFHTEKRRDGSLDLKVAIGNTYMGNILSRGDVIELYEFLGELLKETKDK